MGFESVLGQSAAIGTLERALAGGKVHHAYRFEGPSGVGKEMAAFAFAQALVCTTPPKDGQAHAACGQCSACTRAVTLTTEPPHVPVHPDVILLERALYSAEALRRSRVEVAEISVDQIRRLVLERASFPPHEGKARVFIMRRAHELSISAANALLKTLEEPLAATYFVLMTDRGNELLTTVRSRTQLVRFAPLGESLVRGILEKRGVAAETAQMASELSAGSAATAIDLADSEASAERRAFIEAAIGAAQSSDLGAAVALSDARARDKEVLKDRLAALSAYFARRGRSVIATDPAKATRAAHAYEVVANAIDELTRNGSPALVLETMVAKLRREL
ncbi:MAG TPA: DNA polymerase III subunit [Polyangiaceae bacterium]|nr:DNA polymerase III subunit [Polyangiaceae bacterium]